MFFPHALLHTTEHFFFFCLLSKKNTKLGIVFTILTTNYHNRLTNDCMTHANDVVENGKIQ